jgi:hypothetical protein
MIQIFRCAAATALILIGANSASAQTPSRGPSLPVLELYTSQGCSSCPAADALFKSYAARADVIALSMSVDYWDYLGWKDTLASPKFSKRQRAYAKARADGQVYTPQVVINGREHVVGSSKTDIEAALKASTAKPRSVSMRAALDKGTVTIDIAQAGDTSGEATVWLAVVQTEAQIDVKAGENQGRKLTYYNVVRDIVPAGMWSGPALTIRQPASALATGANQRFAVIVQQGTGGPIVAAAWADPATN